MPKEPQKTNAMRMLARAGIDFEPIYYQISDEAFSGTAVAALLGVDPATCFKTLCARGERRGILVFLTPVAAELDLKAAAAAAGDKRVELTAAKELLSLTGYVRGGVSPVGMKKAYPTYLDASAQLYPKIEISAGAKGCSLLLAPDDLLRFLKAHYAPLAR